MFLSHAFVDQEAVESVKQQLTAMGVHLYLAEHDPRPGTLVAKKVQDAIKRTDLVVVLFSVNGANSRYVHQEIGYALHAGKIVVPILDRSVDNSCLAMLDGVEWISVDLTDAAGTMAALNKMLAPYIKKHADKADAELLVGAALLLIALYFAARSSSGGS